MPDTVVDKPGPAVLEEKSNTLRSLNHCDVPKYDLDDSAHAEFGPKPTQPCHPEHELGRWNSSRIYERIIYYYLSHENSIEPLTSSKDSLSALSDALRIITAEWLNVCHIIECEITKLSEQHENGEHTLEDMDDEL